MAKRKVELVVISDVHLGFAGCKAKQLHKYLRSIQPETLIINGDFIDFWQLRKYYFPKAHAKVIRRVAKMINAGVKVYYLTGNHDEVLRKYSGFQLGNLALEDQLILDLDGKKHWFFHGDIFDVSMHGARWLAKLGNTGYELLILINGWINNLLWFLGKGDVNFSKAIKDYTKKGVKKLGDHEMAAAEVAMNNGYDVVINGHVHFPVMKELELNEKKITYLNSGDWVENMTALEYNKAKWELVYFKKIRFEEDIFRIEEDDLPG